MKVARKLKHYIYGVTLVFITLSGFGQMPIFKRYYIADIPGLGWLARFYVTHMVHYIAAIVLIALATYVVFDFIFKRSGFNRITGYGYFKTGIIAGLIVTGAFMVVKNLSHIYFAHTTIIALDIVHLSLCVMLLIVSSYTLILKKRWVS